MDPASTKLLLALSQRAARSKTVRRFVVLCVVGCVIALSVVVLAPLVVVSQFSQASRGGQAALLTEACDAPLGAVSGSAALGLGQDQLKNAGTIVAVGKSLNVPAGGLVVALAAALQESGLRNLDYGDRDSLGLFQQRPSSGWGTRAEITNPALSAAAFFGMAKQTSNPGLLDIRGWEAMSVGAAAQAVQRSAFPDAYDDNEPLARRLVAHFGAAAPAGNLVCGAAGAMECPSSGSAAENGLQPDALRVIRCLHQRWPQITSWGGVGSRSTADSDHPAGKAVDAMIPNYTSTQGVQLGNTMAAWLVANRKQLGVKYVIWNTRIWSVEREAEGWRDCGTPQGSCYSGPDATAAHRDHVHISVYGNVGGTNDGDPGTAAASGRIVLPVAGYHLTAGFGQCGSAWSHCHTGQDFAVHGGTPIHAVMDGTVVYVHWGGAYGNLTKIQHAGGVQTWYAHQKTQAVHVGQTVRAGEVIGQVGWTGNVRPRGPAGAHVHLEIRVNGDPTDPLKWLHAHGVEG